MCVKELLARKTKTKCTPLLLAAEKGHKRCVELFLENGAGVEAVDEDGWSTVDEDGWSALHHASYGGYGDVVQLLIEHRADINWVASKDDWCPIHAATRSLKVHYHNR